jgi:hypothetical protein
MRVRIIVVSCTLALVACGDDGVAPASSSAPLSTTIAITTSTPAAASTSITSPATSTTSEDDRTEVEVVVAGGSIEVTVDGVPESGRARIAIGTEVRLTVVADVTSDVHLHGYDETADVSPGNPAIIDFTADIPGIFEVELHSGQTLLVELQVS